ncbi:14182_t:CDS:1 [Dentiscutata heterogama]|uniref:14182_t:CDS:1 n=1 Tax=Dentiscutata heterogama TaxID=1316150 RepID=A0ACA9LSA2_9GLOM|nr:14182_t:CDS:1 [Dentiscutata heterogama]
MIENIKLENFASVAENKETLRNIDNESTTHDKEIDKQTTSELLKELSNRKPCDYEAFNAVVHFNEIIFINKHANQNGNIAKLPNHLRFTSKYINALLLPKVLSKVFKFSPLQVEEILFRNKLFDRFRFELLKLELILDHHKMYDIEILKEQKEITSNLFYGVFDEYVWSKTFPKNAFSSNSYDLGRCIGKLNNLAKSRKRMATIAKKKAAWPKVYRFIPYKIPNYT